MCGVFLLFFFFQAEDGIRDFCLSRGLGDVYKRQQVAFLPLGGIKEDWTVAGDARQELVSRLHEVGEMAVKDGVVIGIRTPLDAGGDIKLLKEINSKGIKIYYSFQNALENGRDLCKELKKLGKDRICQIHCTDTDGVTLPYNTRLDMNAVKHTLDTVSYTHLRAHETGRNLVCRLLLEKKK